jgi:hypothetical protein
MTRETKIGLVVSCSFLCLVGVVLGNKLREMGRNQGAEVASANEPDQDVKADKETHESDVGKVVPASAEEIKKLDPAPDAAEGKVLSVKANPAKEKEEPDLPPGEEVDSSKSRTPAAAKDKDKDVPIDIPSDNSKPLPNGKDGDLPADEPEEKKDKKDTIKDKKDTELGGKDKKATQVDSDPVPDDKQPKAKAGKTNEEIDGPPDKKEPKPARIQSGNNKADDPPGLPSDIDSVPAADDPDGKREDKDKKSPVKVDAPVVIGQPKAKSTSPDPIEGALPDLPKTEKETRPAVDVVVPSRQPIEKQPAATEREPGRQPIQVATAPYRRIPVTSGPEVESFDEEIYKCRAGDSFARISQRYYQTDKYGQALEAFNRNHPQDGDAIRRQASGLAIGQRVHIPPIAVLRKRHGTLITEESQQASPEAREERTSSRPRANQDPEENAPRSRDYTVNNPNGETMREIAEKLLGDVNRWQEIAKLNPGFQPLLPIPATASIKLP